VLGTVLATAGLLLLARISDTTPYALTAAGLAVLGLGLGCIMQNLVLIVQNSVPQRTMGAAISTTNYFRQIGATFGISLFGSIFINRLAGRLDPADLPGRGGISSLSPAVLRSLPAPARAEVARAFGQALPPIFLLAVPLILAALVLALCIREIPLSDTVGGGTGS
jgi:dipeptide/tripeptide permease